MTTLKEHQAAMVDLLANGSGIPASASRLAHAMHDLIQNVLMGQEGYDPVYEGRHEATTPGLNDKALSKREKARKTDSPAKWPTPAEQRVKELENTIRQLRASNAKLRAERAELKDMLGVDPAYYRVSEQAGCRKEDTQLMQECPHSGPATYYGKILRCDNCGAEIPE